MADNTHAFDSLELFHAAMLDRNLNDFIAQIADHNLIERISYDGISPARILELIRQRAGVAGQEEVLSHMIRCIALFLLRGGNISRALPKMSVQGREEMTRIQTKYNILDTRNTVRNNDVLTLPRICSALAPLTIRVAWHIRTHVRGPLPAYAISGLADIRIRLNCLTLPGAASVIPVCKEAAALLNFVYRFSMDMRTWATSLVGTRAAVKIVDQDPTYFINLQYNSAYPSQIQRWAIMDFLQLSRAGEMLDLSEVLQPYITEEGHIREPEPDHRIRIGVNTDLALPYIRADEPTDQEMSDEEEDDDSANGKKKPGEDTEMETQQEVDVNKDASGSNKEGVNPAESAVAMNQAPPVTKELSKKEQKRLEKGQTASTVAEPKTVA